MLHFRFNLLHIVIEITEIFADKLCKLPPALCAASQGVFDAFSYASHTMKQIRIVRKGSVYTSCGPRFVSEWMGASLLNRWFLKTRLVEALQAHGSGSHWIETRETVPAQEMGAA